jgi:hypothetical protein
MAVEQMESHRHLVRAAVLYCHREGSMEDLLDAVCDWAYLNPASAAAILDEEG